MKKLNANELVDSEMAGVELSISSPPKALIEKIHNNNLNEIKKPEEISNSLMLTALGIQKYESLNTQFDGDGCTFKYVGKTSKNQNSYICLHCDPKKEKPMCLSCVNNCHKPCQDKGYQYIQSIDYYSICACAQDKHKIEEIKVELERTEVSCYCLDVPLYREAYLYKTSSGKLICSVCRLLCFEWDFSDNEKETYERFHPRKIFK